MKFTIGDRVRVLSVEVYKNTPEVKGCLGTVESARPNSEKYGVRLDGLTNPGSGKGLFYFSVAGLVKVKNTENENTTLMEEKEMHKITNHLNVARIQFLDDPTPFGSVYDYANFDPDLRANDLVVVMSAHHGMGLAQVVDIQPKTGEALQREIVAKVNTQDYDARVEKREKAAELKAKMQERAKQLQDISLYKLLAADDPDMAQMLKDYLDLGNV